MDPVNPVVHWVQKMEHATGQIAATSGQGDADVSVRALRDLLVLVAEGYPHLYENGVVAKILRDDAAARISELDRLQLERHVTVHELVERELGASGGDVMVLRTGPHWGVREVCWSIRVVQFVAKLFDVLAVPDGPSVGHAGQVTYSEVLQPYHGWLKGQIVRFVLGMAPSREQLLVRADLSRERDAEGVVLMLRIKDACYPLFHRLNRYYLSRGLIFPEKV